MTRSIAKHSTCSNLSRPSRLEDNLVECEESDYVIFSLRFEVFEDTLCVHSQSKAKVVK